MIRQGDIPELVRSLQRAKAEAAELGTLARAIFFIGAGCSRSAGVPLAAEIAKTLVPRLAQTYGLGQDVGPDDAFWLLHSAGYFSACAPDRQINWYAVYDEAFLNHYKTPDHARNIFKKAIATSFKGINWAHLCLGELVAQSFCSTVITTNFDLLALEGIVSAGVIPVVSDGLESLGRINGTPDHPQLIQLNGSIHSYRLRNRPDEIVAVGEHSGAASCFRELIRSTDVLVFVGYAGREVAIMNLVSAALTEYAEKEVYWCIHGGSTSELTPQAIKLLESNPNARVILDQDADRFFFELCRDLGVGAPGFIRNPVTSIKNRLKGIALPEGSGPAGEIRDEIARFTRKVEVLSKHDLTEGLDNKSIIMDEASGARFRGDDRAALKAVEPLLEQSPGDAEVWGFASLLALSIASATLAQPDIERAVGTAKKAFDLVAGRGDQSEAEAQFKYASALELRGTGRSSLEDVMLALENYEAASAIMDPEKDEDLWIRTRNNVGIINAKIADIEDSDEHIENALRAFDEILERIEGRDREDFKGQVLTNKAVALFTLGEYKGDADTIRRAIALHNEALAGITKVSNPKRWSIQMRSLASCYGVLSILEDDVAAAEESVRLIKESLDPVEGDDPSNLTGVKFNYGRALARLGQLRKDIALVNQAVDLLMEAREEFGKLGMDWQVNNADATLLRLHGIIEELQANEQAS